MTKLTDDDWALIESAIGKAPVSWLKTHGALELSEDSFAALLSAARQARTQGPGEVGWLVEHYASKRGEYLAEWLTGWPAFDDSAPDTWTKDNTKAIRFARREDAEQVIQALGWTEARATEHVWSAPPASQIKEG